MGNTKAGLGRTRNFATVVYEESAPSNWREILQELLIPCFVSPYHCEDVNADGEKKKPHWHVLLMFEGVKTTDQAIEIFNKIGGVGCEKVNSLRGYARYLCHLDNPDKYQYNISDVVSYCGADYLDCINLITDKYKVLEEMILFCEKYKVCSFYLLSKYAFSKNESWRRVLSDSGSVFMKEYLKSKLWSEQNHNLSIVDSETGEILL